MRLLRKLIHKLKTIRITAAMVRTFTFELIRAGFIALFVYAAYIKLMDVQKFTVQLGQSPLLMAFAHLVAKAVPVTEFVIVVLLLIPRTLLIGLIASFTLMVAFSMYIIVLLLFASHVPCSCGGILSDTSHEAHLVFNVMCVILAVTGIALLEKQQKATAFATSKLSYA